MSEFNGEVVLITGAAVAGLGKYLFENFAKKRAKLFLVDINGDKLA